MNLLSFPPTWFADPPNLQTYEYIFTGKIPESYEQRGALRSMISNEVRDVPRAVLTSIVVATAVMVINFIVGSLAAYAYARIRFPGRTAAFNFVLMSRLIPSVAIAVPYYLIVPDIRADQHLLGADRDLLGADAPLHHSGPDALFPWAARGDRRGGAVKGASPWRILRDIAIPLALPSIIGAGLFSFMLAYSEFLFALFITTTSDRRTLPVILGALSANTDVTWNMLMASIAVGTVPTLLLAIPVWRFMVRNLTSGAVRG